jgi:hypothetical protein
MPGDKQGAIHGSSDGGVQGAHPDSASPQLLVAPSTAGEFNNTRLPLIPIACWRVDDIRFAFDSSFVAATPSNDPAATPNDIRAELQNLITLVQAHPGCPLSVFGHADPVGDDDYNKHLSGRRATAIYALLIFNSDSGAAIKLWNSIAHKENWGSQQREMMQNFTGLPAGTQDSALIQAYLQKLVPPALKLAKTDFLARGADAAGKGDYQGCSEFNPLLLFSAEKQADYDQAAKGDKKDPAAQEALNQRNADNAPNRRVLVLMFRKGSRIDPAKWPCPTASEGPAACRKRFWDNGEFRRSNHLSGVDRKFEDKPDTFACRFYQRISSSSPCESTLPPTVKITLEAAVACPGHRFKITAAGSPASGDYQWTISGADLVDEKGKPTKTGPTVFLRSYRPDNDKGNIPEQKATVGVTYVTAQGSATDSKDVTVHKIDFVVTNDTVSAGRVVAIESAAGVSMWNDPTTGSPEMTTKPSVQIKLDSSCPRKDQCALDFQAGWLQTMLTNDRRVRYSKNQVTWTCPMPIRDVMDPDDMKPFYHEAYVLGFTADGDTLQAEHQDSPNMPSAPAPWNAGSAAGPLRQVFFSNSFTAWLVVQSTEWAKFDVPGSFVYLRNFDWSIQLNVAVDVTKAVGSRCTPSFNPVQVGAVGTGKGSSSPNLKDPYFNKTLSNGKVTNEPTI